MLKGQEDGTFGFYPLQWDLLLTHAADVDLPGHVSHPQLSCLPSQAPLCAGRRVHDRGCPVVSAMPSCHLFNYHQNSTAPRTEMCEWFLAAKQYSGRAGSLSLCLMLGNIFADLLYFWQLREFLSWNLIKFLDDLFGFSFRKEHLF